MKISQEEIDAAWGHASVTWHTDTKRFMERALEAAYIVRKQRKAAKRERQRKEKDKQVVESVKPADARMSDLSKAFYEASKELALKPSNIERAKNFLRSSQLNAVMATPSKDPEWDGTFSTGEWQMRNGEKALVKSTIEDVPYCLSGFIGNERVLWSTSGRICRAIESAEDLIRPWPKGEQ